ncbi:MAG: Ig-like domain-containing protein [Gemmatimonadota bacterium]
MTVRTRTQRGLPVVALLLLWLAGCDALGPVLDSTPPRVKVSAISDTIPTGEPVVVSGAAIDHGGVKRVTVRVDGGSESDVTIQPGRYVEFNATVAVPAEGVDTIVVTAYDEANNHASADVTVRKDVSGPQIDLQLPDSVLVRDTVMVRAVIRDPSRIAHVRVHYADGARDVPVSLDTMVVLETPQPVRDGAYLLAVEAVDGVGNVGASRSVTIYADQAPPRMLFHAPLLAAGDSAEVAAFIEDYLDPYSIALPGSVTRVTSVQPDDTETVLWSGSAPSVDLRQTLPVPAQGGPWTLAAYDELDNRAAPSAPSVPFRQTVDLSTSGGFTCVVDAAGEGWCWGDNTFGELGRGGGAGSDVPEPVVGGHTVTRIATSPVHACALDTNGAAWCWGRNWHGELGDGTTTQSSTPVAVASDSTFTALATGYGHTCALDANGYAWCWGLNWDGQLGTGDTIQSHQPVRSGTGTYTSIAAANSYTCAIGTDGNVYCWGSYPGAPTPSPTPVAITSNGHLTRISAGAYTACAVDDAGDVWCWGQDLVTGITHSQPTQVSGLGPVSDVTVGLAFGCALGTDEQVRCWGLNDRGQSGTASRDSLLATPAVALQGIPFRRIAADDYHTCGIDLRGSVYCWGSDNDAWLHGW